MTDHIRSRSTVWYKKNCSKCFIKFIHIYKEIRFPRGTLNIVLYNYPRDVINTKKSFLLKRYTRHTKQDNWYIQRHKIKKETDNLIYLKKSTRTNLLFFFSRGTILLVNQHKFRSTSYTAVYYLFSFKYVTSSFLDI